MIIVEIKGGLGNQLFQYAYGRALAEREGDYLVLSQKWYKYGDRDYHLHHYPIKTRPFSWWRRKLVSAGRVEYHEGYWQSEDYFRDCEELIRREYQPKVAVSGCEPMRAVESVSLHVRRGDYVQHETRAAVHGVCLRHYYPRAISLIQERLKNPHFFIFSDEPEWVRENMKIDAPMTVMEMGAPHEDMVRMSSCQHHIMANSSFSWWGAWLNPSKEKIVTAPDQWFKAPGYDTSNLIPESWIKLSCSAEKSESAHQSPAAPLTVP